jgi:RNA 3'-terminal phosphate cyclase (ATP)
MTVTPAPSALRAITLTEPGHVQEIRGIAFSSHLATRRVSERMALACQERLERADLRCDITRVDDTTALRPGACLTIWATSSTECIFGADRAGAPRRTSESIGRYVSGTLLADLRSGATVDRHSADQLVPFAALARGTSRYVPPSRTDHLATNLWLASKFGARYEYDERVLTVEGLGLLPHSGK